MLSRLSRTPDQHLRQYRATITLRMSRANAPRVVVGHLRSGGIGHSPCLQTVPTNRASASVRVLNGPARGVRTRSALSSCSRSCTTYQPAPPSGVTSRLSRVAGVRRCAYTISGRTLGISWLHRQLPNAGVQTRYHTTIRKSVRSAPFDHPEVGQVSAVRIPRGARPESVPMMAISALRRTLPPARARTIGASGRSVRDMRGRHHFSCHARSARYERASRQKRTPVALRTGALNHPNVGSARSRCGAAPGKIDRVGSGSGRRRDTIRRTRRRAGSSPAPGSRPPPSSKSSWFVLAASQGSLQRLLHRVSTFLALVGEHRRTLTHTVRHHHQQRLPPYPLVAMSPDPLIKSSPEPRTRTPKTTQEQQRQELPE